MGKIKSRREILNDIIKAGEKHPKGWKAVLGEDHKRMSRDYYLFNPKTGIYFLKEYNKNPYKTKGVGGKIARKVDEHIESQITKNKGDFGIIQGNYKKILKNLKKGIKPKKIFSTALKQKEKDLGLRMPIKGNASSSKKTFKNVHKELSDKQEKIDSKLEEMADKDGLYKSYG